ncbi:MAG: hypothetical protein GWN99_18000 [Gemmatimonadetes bacterium]|uniref:DinB-like domain-containing protein n=1 Tax=Candidatus Kutchimonas denitrificans TaxID=3056748 RepID=A0AAE4Z9P3_9BACT|nr:hypothetical protein [Gemmatimonadota bacterium]NIR75628.1 hypothetical protein [Candidatus Kutchimonas denitrificans]NIS02929.1 hypothetical protein [Gemmatimonadota bacterium]NIT68651.1 hypothetical protein [Gemmatimonadota bacterium]NIV25330.1 hypothetical protein [Gemmatimonadota bacterium]
MSSSRTMRHPNLRSLVIVFALSVTTAGSAAAQYLGGGTKDEAEVQIADLEQMRDKFVALAEVFPEELYDWRPMEGVRSVHDVMSLIAAEGGLFPTMWDYSAPEWAAEGGFRGELSRLGGLGKEELISELQRSFDHCIGIVRGLSDEERARQVNFFGLTVDLGTAVTLMANDMHEHLGQSIAYARMNQIVPPWSRREGM